MCCQICFGHEKQKILEKKIHQKSIEFCPQHCFPIIYILLPYLNKTILEMIDVCDLWERDKGEHSSYLTGRLWSYKELLGLYINVKYILY